MSGGKPFPVLFHGTVTAVALFLTGIPVCQVHAEVRMEGCVQDDKGKYAEVNLEQGREVSFTCTGISPDRTVEWSVGNGLRDVTLGSCPPPDGSQSASSCTSADEGVALLSRPSPTESRMTIKQSIPRRLLENKSLYCSEKPNGSRDYCPVDIIMPAQGTCKAEFVTSSHPWKVRVNCEVTSGNSTRNRYKCRLYQRPKERGHFILLGGWTSMVGASLPRTCQMTVPLNISTPQSYRVALMPGHRVLTAAFQGSNEISRPDPPRIVCKPDGWVPENSNLSCMCTTSHVGLPEGHLRWSEGSGGYFDTEDPLKIRKRGFKHSRMNIAVTRQDNHKKQLRCDVVWAQNVTGPVKDVTVGYPASQVAFTINGGQLVSENSLATFTCTARDGLPPPHVILRKKVAGSKILANRTTALDHTESHVRCEDSGVYKCIAGNGMGPDKMVEATLGVTCAPRDISRQIGPVYNQEEEIQFYFDVIANPSPSLVEFSFLGQVEEEEVVEENTPSEVEGISLSGRCGRKEGGEVYMSTCTVTVHNVTSQAAEGLYRGTVRNEAGSVTFDFQVKVGVLQKDAGPMPAVTIAGFCVGGLIIILLVTLLVISHRSGSGFLKFHRRIRREDNNPTNANVLPMVTLGHVDSTQTASGKAGSRAQESTYENTGSRAQESTYENTGSQAQGSTYENTGSRAQESTYKNTGSRAQGSSSGNTGSRARKSRSRQADSRVNEPSVDLSRHSPTGHADPGAGFGDQQYTNVDVHLGGHQSGTRGTQQCRKKKKKKKSASRAEQAASGTGNERLVGENSQNIYMNEENKYSGTTPSNGDDHVYTVVN